MILNFINIESINLDYEAGLISSINKILPKIRIIGYSFHYMNNLEKNSQKFGIYIFEKTSIDDIIKILGNIPLVYNNDHNFIDMIFKKIISNYNEKYDKTTKK